MFYTFCIIIKYFASFLDCKNAVLFFLFHSAFIPTSKKTTRNGKGDISLNKFSIRDPQNCIDITGIIQGNIT